MAQRESAQGMSAPTPHSERGPTVLAFRPTLGRLPVWPAWRASGAPRSEARAVLRVGVIAGVKFIEGIEAAKVF